MSHRAVRDDFLFVDLAVLICLLIIMRTREVLGEAFGKGVKAYIGCFVDFCFYVEDF